MHITQEEQRSLLSDARETIRAKLEERRPAYGREGRPAYGRERGRPAEAPGSLGKPSGAFVTLHIGGELRGCIGRMTAAAGLQETVRAMAEEAAFGDPRFPPLTKAELPRCRIEISALSPMTLCPDPQSVIVGVHGLYLTHRGRAGVLLPQVPVEQGWDLAAYLNYLCLKAGLPPLSYQEPEAKLYTFTATVFGEPAE